VPVDEVAYAAAIVSGRYNLDELKEIANRETLAAGMKVMWERQQARTGEVWTGLLNRLPLPVGG